jgi:hypothetical protein
VTLDQMLFGMAKSKHRIQGLCEALELALGIIRCDEVLDYID